MNDLTQIVHQAAEPNSFSTYRNVDFGTIKGVEAVYEMRRSGHVGVQASYTLSHSTGTGSTPISHQIVAWQGTTPPTVPTPLDHDQRHKLTASLDLRAGNREGPAIGGWHVLENAGVNFTLQAGSGFPYTPTEVDDILSLVSTGTPNLGAINSRYGPWTAQVDMKATKAWGWGGGRLEFQLWVINLFNHKNTRFVYSTTGLPNTTGWLETPTGQDWLAGFDGAHDSSNLTAEQKYRMRENDPANFGVPRQVRAGIKFSF